MRILTTALTVTALSALAACGGANDTEAPADEATALEGDDASIASALSAGPSDVTDGATILDAEGNVLREGTNGWTCIA